MVSSRPTTVSALSQQHSWPPACAGALLWAGKIPRGPDDQQGHTLVLSAGTGKDFRMSEAVGRKGQKKTVDFGGM